MSIQNRPAVSPAVVSSQPPRHGPPMLALGLAALVTGCGTGDEAGAPAHLEPSSRAQSVVVLPSTCQDIQAANPNAGDGNYVLYVSGSASQAWTAYCHGMGTVGVTPTEYLPLVRTGPGSNFSQYSAGGNSPGTTVRTVFTRLRIDPQTLKVNTADQSFSSSEGSLSHNPDTVTSMPYAAAMGCNTTGLANIDLSGTPFAVPTSQIRIGGVSTGGATFTYGAGNQVVNMASRGYCGWIGPVGSFNLYNQNGAPLQLYYVGPQ